VFGEDGGTIAWFYFVLAYEHGLHTGLGTHLKNWVNCSSGDQANKSWLKS